MRIMWDLDDVLYQFNQRFLEKAQEVKHVSQDVTVEQITMRDYAVIGMSEKQVKDVFACSIWDTGKPETALVRSFLSLQSLGCKNYIVTARPQRPWIMGATRTWLRKHIDRGYEGLHFVEKDQKVQWCLDWKADLAIEDCHDTASALCQAGIPTLLVDRPWNSNFVTPEKVVRGDVEVIGGILNKIAKDILLERQTKASINATQKVLAIT